MEERISVVVCVGTACYVLGGSELLEVGERLPLALRDRVRLEGCTCMGLCGGSGAERPPFARVNGRLVAGATAERLAQAIREAAGEEDA